MGLDAVELVMAFEEAFGLEIPDKAAEGMQTPRKVVDYLAEQKPDLPQWVVETKVQAIICDQLGLDEAAWDAGGKGSWDRDFIMDLGMD